MPLSDPDEMSRSPLVLPLGDGAALVRFADALSAPANRKARAFAAALRDRPIPGVLEVAPSLVSVLLRYDPGQIGFWRLSGEIGLVVSRLVHLPPEDEGAAPFPIPVAYGGEAGPDLEEVAAALGLSPEAFVARHAAARLRVLATGFAPGFVYCGFHEPALELPRRREIRPFVPAGTVLFAAGQTAIAATDLPTGWHVIGRTRFINFDPTAIPPTRLLSGAMVQFPSRS